MLNQCQDGGINFEFYRSTADKDGTIRYIDSLQELWDQALMDAVEGSAQAYKQEHKGLKYNPRAAFIDEKSRTRSTHM